jgi:exosortase
MTLRAPNEFTLGSMTAALLVYVVTVGVLHAETLVALFDHASRDESASHVLLIPLVSGFLLYQRRAEIRAHLGPGLTGPRILVLGVCAALAVGNRWALNEGAAEHLTSAVALVVVLWVAGFAAVFGGASTRMACFPLFFLGFMIPPPPALIESASHLLKAGSAEAVAVLFTAIGMPYFRDGYVFELPAVAIRVADECSGIRSSIALILTSLLAGYAMLPGVWRTGVLVVAAVAITILKNGVRIVSLSWLATYVDPGFLTGRLHRDGGVAFFLLGVALLSLILAVLRRPRPRSSSRRLPAAPAPSAGRA